MDLNAIESMAIAALRKDWDAARMLADYLCENVFSDKKLEVTPVRGISGQGNIDVMVFWSNDATPLHKEAVSTRIREWLKNGGVLHVGPNVVKVELFRIQGEGEANPAGGSLEILQPATPGQIYYDAIYCGHCNTDTSHRCYDSGHGRDSTGDWRTCLQCNWRWSGLTGVYEPPAQEPHSMTEEEMAGIVRYALSHRFRPDPEKGEG